MQALALARLDGKLPHPHVLALEDDAIADRAQDEFVVRLFLQHQASPFDPNTNLAIEISRHSGA